MIGAALALAAQFAPSIIGMIAGPKAEDVASTVVNTAQAITGTDSPDAAKVALEKNPEMAVKFQQAANELEATIIRERGSTMRAALEADANSKHTTRPRIAYGFAWVIGMSVIMLMASVSVAIINSDSYMLEKIGYAWPVIAAALVPMVEVLRAYFGILKQEHADKLAVGNGHPPVGGAIASIVKAFKG